MRCLGRLVTLFFLVLVAGAAWLYRDEIGRWVDARMHPGAAVLRVGRPTPAGLRSATTKLESLGQRGADSVILTPGEMASLIARGTAFVPGVTFDSISVELGDRTTTIRTLVDSSSLPATVRTLIPGGPRRYEELVVRGELTPVRAGLAELEVQHVSLRGVPLPAGLVARLATQARGRAADGRIEVTLPPGMSGFRVRPNGVTVYRSGAGR